MIEPASIAHDEILIVDDTTANLRLLSDILSNAGYKVRPASDGETALRSVKAKAPALILLDIKMPVMDGLEVCHQLKADKKTRSIPVIFISVLDEVADKLKGFSAEGVDYITKPFNTGEVLARVKTHLTMRNLVKELEDKNLRLQEANEALQSALDEIKTLRGILPICSYCKKIRDDKGYWNQIESYIHKHSGTEFSHGICPECAKKLYPDMDIYDDNGEVTEDR